MVAVAAGQGQPGPQACAVAAAVPVPECLFGASARGIAARAALLEAWCAVFGRFGCVPRSHAWVVQITAPSETTVRCQPTLLEADLRHDHWNPSAVEPPCGCWETEGPDIEPSEAPAD